MFKFYVKEINSEWFKFEYILIVDFIYEIFNKNELVINVLIMIIYVVCIYFNFDWFICCDVVVSLFLDCVI